MSAALTGTNPEDAVLELEYIATRELKSNQGRKPRLVASATSEPVPATPAPREVVPTLTSRGRNLTILTPSPKRGGTA